MTERTRAIAIVIAVYVFVAVVVVMALGEESDPCQAWLDRHGEPNARCLAP